MLRRRRTHNDFTHRLTQPLVLEDGRPPKVLSWTLYVLSGFVVLAIAWGTLTSVRETTTVTGQIVPRGQILNVQHFEGGIVDAVLVREGETVKAGDPVIRLDPVGSESDRNQLESRKVALTLQLIRLNALSRGEVPNFSNVAPEHAALVSEQVQLYSSAVQQRQSEDATLAARIAQRQSELAGVRSDLANARLQAETQREQLAIQSKLIVNGHTSKKTYLEWKLAAQKAEGEIANLEAKLKSAEDAATEAEKARTEARANAERKIAEERAKAASDLAETQQQLAKLSDRVERLLVRAPSDGYVLELGPKSAGEVIKAGDTVARIVPAPQELIADVRIEARDSGHINVGSPAIIKFTTFDSALYGTVQGSVEYISASAFMPQAGQIPLPGQAPSEPYYRAFIRLARDSVGSGALTRPITPGMVVQAQIVTGSKSIVRYMLKPVFNSLDVIFTER
ncbi:HlyD family type I secretion periplasmic adaptor subunit [Blastochloris tepida]|uniref:Membrane fusion protein (MFP) family protein n=1 Tax=Blastochloris tepida TaxID=2233851 RepID=A0A348FZ46_9HYPH|nr:HlyD family type I secretion periplasmic adaptor subunit [Blastochloris tepida]BBF92579.1 HlyD family type I secretion periplasmic adaptor subunit [Blastochloris tepida]